MAAMKFTILCFKGSLKSCELGHLQELHVFWGVRAMDHACNRWKFVRSSFDWQNDVMVTSEANVNSECDLIVVRSWVENDSDLADNDD